MVMLHVSQMHQNESKIPVNWRIKIACAKIQLICEQYGLRYATLAHKPISARRNEMYKRYTTKIRQLFDKY